MKKFTCRILRSAVLLAAFFMLGSCVVAPAGPGEPGVILVPPLPAIVILEQEPYYYHSGYYYYYQNNRWFYSHKKSGPWMDLPRGHYPKETRFKDRDDDKGRGKHGDDDRDKDWKRGHNDGEHH